MLVKSSMDAVVSTTIPTAPMPRAMRAERSDDQSEEAWKSRRLTNRRTRTAMAKSDSSMSAAATRCRTIVPGQEDHGHPPGPPLAPQDAPTQGDEGQSGHGDEGPGGDAGPEG